MDFPVEIIRQIVETAVVADYTSGPALALTCRSFNKWATPLLYESVTLDKDNVRPFIRGVEAAQCGTIDTGAYVKRLCIHRSAMQHSDWTLSLCKSISHLLLSPSLRELSEEHDHEKVPDVPLWPKPTHISILFVPKAWFLPRLPLFSHVTHLYIDDVLEAEVLSVCSVLPLTHICFNIWSDPPDVGLIMNSVQFLLQSETMQCVLIHALAHGEPIDDFFGGIWSWLASIPDERLTVAPGMTRDHLIECFEEGQTVWDNIDEWKDWRQMARFKLYHDK